MKTIEIISLIYKSTDYLTHIENELRSQDFSGLDYNVKLTVVANDPIEKIKNIFKAEPKRDGVYRYIYQDINPDEYYINRVYRCYNWAGLTSDADYLCFINSDMIFAKGWLHNLMRRYDGVNIPCCRLVESGRLRSGQYGIEKDFGMTLPELKPQEFHEYAKQISFDTTKDGGLFMPYVISRETFIASGMYPEGNIYQDGIGTTNGNVIASGDNYFFSKLHYLYGMKHVTCFDSIIYHLQEGERSCE